MSKVSLGYRKDEIKKDGEVPLFASFSIQGKQKHIRLSETFPLEKIEGKELKSGRDPILDSKAKRIRAKISLIEIEIEKGRTSNVPDIYEHVKARLAEESGESRTKKGPDLLMLWKEWELHNESRISPQTNELISDGTKKNYKTVRGHLEVMNSRKRLDVTLLGKEFYGDFSAYVLTELQLAPNTLSMYIKIIKTFMSWADETLEERGVEISRKYVKFKTPTKYKGVNHLNSSELKLFQDFQTNDKDLRLACDLFLMMCYTGLSVGDLKRLRDDFEYSAERMMLTSRKKTRNECVIPLFDDHVFRPVELLNRYGWKFPYMPDSKVNMHIKTVARRVKFTKFKMETRIGRKTFASIKHLEQKVPSHIVMRATGHKTEKNFLRYIGTDHRSVIEAFEDGASFLKAV
jgi:integrase